MAQSDIGDWYRGIPQITRGWFTGSVVIPLAAKFGLLNPMWLILTFQQVVYRFQVWRPITALFYYPITPMTGFHYLIQLYFLYNYSRRLETDNSSLNTENDLVLNQGSSATKLTQTNLWRPITALFYIPLTPRTGFHYLITLYFMYNYSKRLEQGVFDGRPADYLFMLIFNWICLVIIGFIAPLMLLMDPMVLSVLYVWCQLNRDAIVQFWFGTQFKAMYLPWVLVAFNMIIRGAGLSELLGIVVGHLYFFLMFKYPQDFGGRAFLSTPKILYKYFPNRQGGVSGFGIAPASRRPREDNNDQGAGLRHRWGRGQELGQ